MADWWVFAHGQEMGPVSAERLIALARSQNVAGIHVWRKGLEDWQPIGDVAELQPQSRTAPELTIVADARVVPPAASRSSYKKIWAIAGALIGLAIGLAKV